MWVSCETSWKWPPGGDDEGVTEPLVVAEAPAVQEVFPLSRTVSFFVPFAYLLSTSVGVIPPVDLCPLLDISPSFP